MVSLFVLRHKSVKWWRWYICFEHWTQYTMPNNFLWSDKPYFQNSFSLGKCNLFGTTFLVHTCSVLYRAYVTVNTFTLHMSPKYQITYSNTWRSIVMTLFLWTEKGTGSETWWKFYSSVKPIIKVFVVFFVLTVRRISIVSIHFYCLVFVTH